MWWCWCLNMTFSSLTNTALHKGGLFMAQPKSTKRGIWAVTEQLCRQTAEDNVMSCMLTTTKKKLINKQKKSESRHSTKKAVTGLFRDELLWPMHESGFSVGLLPLNFSRKGRLLPLLKIVDYSASWTYLLWWANVLSVCWGQRVPEIQTTTKHEIQNFTWLTHTLLVVHANNHIYCIPNHITCCCKSKYFVSSWTT